MQHDVYEPPALAEIGAFSRVTLGRPVWGFDSRDMCLRFNCQ
jgi:hypothetical protein